MAEICINKRNDPMMIPVDNNDNNDNNNNNNNNNNKNNNNNNNNNNNKEILLLLLTQRNQKQIELQPFGAVLKSWQEYMVLGPL